MNAFPLRSQKNKAAHRSHCTEVSGHYRNVKKKKRKYMEWKGSNKAVVFHRQHNRVCKT